MLNEFVAFLQLGPMKAQLDPRSFTIATYALCGFANFSSIAIQIGGIGALAPNRKSDLARLGLRRWRPAPWPTSCRPASRECCCDATKPVDYIQRRTAAAAARSRVVLGSGLGAFADELADRVEIPYAEIPGWPVSTAVGHAGKLVFGKLGELRRGGDGRPRVISTKATRRRRSACGVRVLRRLGVRVHGVHQRRRRHQPVLRARRRWC